MPDLGKKKKILPVALGALGVVFGDIGTSPLYAINEIFYGGHPLPSSEQNILGCISLVIWAITGVITLKYISFVLRADNDGEGGVFALYSLLHRYKNKGLSVFLLLLLLSAGLLFGDGIITPAISVLAAVEGLKVLSPTFAPYVVPLTLIILTCLFAIQSKGTARVGTYFGPIILVWFITDRKN